MVKGICIVRIVCVVVWSNIVDTCSISFHARYEWLEAVESENRDCSTCLCCNPATSVSLLLRSKRLIAEFICTFLLIKTRNQKYCLFVWLSWSVVICRAVHTGALASSLKIVLRPWMDVQCSALHSFAELPPWVLKMMILMLCWEYVVFPSRVSNDIYYCWYHHDH